MLTRIFTFIIASILSANLAAKTCNANPNIIGASYRIEKQNLETQESVSSSFNLWRTDSQVAHENIDSHITDIWDKGHSGRLKLSRYFDQNKRGIEYQPEDIKKGRGDKNWSIKYQLIDNKLLESLTLQKEIMSGCELEHHYSNASSAEAKDAKNTVIWLANLKLLKYYEEIQNNIRITWILEKITNDSKQITLAIRSRERYQTTDYIDIGDNESDPFLLKMINLGFIEHSDTGFYDANGNNMSNRHSGHSH